jgi:hypothetical protein
MFYEVVSVHSLNYEDGMWGSDTEEVCEDLGVFVLSAIPDGCSIV